MARKNETRTKLTEKRKRNQTRQRNIWLGIISLVAVAVVVVLIVVNSGPVGEIRDGKVVQRNQVDRNSMGDPTAPIKVEEFSDFQCPYCRLFADEEEQAIIDNYVNTGKVYFTYTPFSFLDGNAIDGESKSAAQAAYCAADQNKFWEYHDVLFANQNSENAGDFADKRLIAFAEKLGLDMGAFRSCYNGNTYRQQVLDDLTRGRSLGVSATPTFFINGTKVQGYVGLTEAIEAELAK